MNLLYLHGFASGPTSTKGLAFEQHFAARGIAIERLNLRVPSLEHLRLSAMIDVVTDRLGDRAILIGSSLGGLTAARVAARDSRVAALVLMAPAFQLATRWKAILGAEYQTWERTGWRDITDYTTKQPARVDFGFIEDALRVDVGLPEVRVPTLVFHGTRDDSVPIDTSRAFVADRPAARLVELDDGHELVASLPRILAETERFLDEHVPAA